MKKLSKTKRQHLILIVLATAVVIAGCWYGIINRQKAKLREVAKHLADAEQRLSKVQQAVKSADKIEADLKAAIQKLSAIEDGMASGDLFSWFVLKLREFQLNYKLDIPQISRETLGEVTLVPGFPYKQAAYTVRGTGFYQDLGKFIADFENHFPYFRVEKLELEPGLSGTPGDMEKLAFKMDLITLVKSGQP